VRLLHPDRSETVHPASVSNGTLDIGFPDGSWAVSGIVIQRDEAPLASKPQRFPMRPARPSIRHERVATISAGQPESLTLAVRRSTRTPSRVLLHYRPLDANAAFKTIEHTVGAGPLSFTIPAEDVSSDFDLLGDSSGVFHPNPATETPYYVIDVQPARPG